MANADKRRRRSKGRAQHSFLALPHYILRSPEFGRLKPAAVKLLLELAANYNGANNGDLSAAFSQLRARGWKSSDTLSKALKALRKDGWIICTREGGKNRCSLYAVTWWPVDACQGKWLEVAPEKAPSHAWKKSDSVVAMRSNVVAGRTNDAESEAP